jgi:uncharacterized protein DUF4236
MGFLRFRRRISILPGIKLNIGKRGISTSIGVPGAHVTLRPGHTARTTIGAPGSGLSYTEGGQTAVKAPGAAPAIAGASMKGRAWRGWLWIALLLAIALFIGMQYLSQ